MVGRTSPVELLYSQSLTIVSSVEEPEIATDIPSEPGRKDLDQRLNSATTAINAGSSAARNLVISEWLYASPVDLYAGKVADSRVTICEVSD